MLLKIRFTVNLNTNSLLFEILTWIYTHFVPFYTLFGTNAPQQCMQGLHERLVVATTIFKHLNIYKYLYYNRMLRLMSLCLFFSTLLNVVANRLSLQTLFQLLHESITKFAIISFIVFHIFLISYKPCCTYSKFLSAFVCHCQRTCSCVLLSTAKQLRHFAAMRLEDFMKISAHFNPHKKGHAYMYEYMNT